MTGPDHCLLARKLLGGGKDTMSDHGLLWSLRPARAYDEGRADEGCCSAPQSCGIT
jgi:hypothetical protein